MSDSTVVAFKPRTPKPGPVARVRPDIQDLDRMAEMGAELLELRGECAGNPEMHKAFSLAVEAIVNAARLGLIDLGRFAK